MLIYATSHVQFYLVVISELMVWMFSHLSFLWRPLGTIVPSKQDFIQDSIFPLTRLYRIFLTIIRIRLPDQIEFFRSIDILSLNNDGKIGHNERVPSYFTIFIIGIQALSHRVTSLIDK